MPTRHLHFAMLSDPGRVRRQNEDACAASAEDGVFVVCDGVGGAAGGEVASRLAAETFLKGMMPESRDGVSTEEALRAAVEEANRAVNLRARQTFSLRGMATTLVALHFEPAIENRATAGPATAGSTGRGTVWVANVGDSRCYRLRRGRFEQLTHDHSLVEEQVRAGELTREQADHSPIKNVITRAVGSSPSVDADLHSLPVEAGDLFLLASDGLTRDLSDGEIAALLESNSALGDAGLAAVCERLIQTANEKGGGDNITCVLVEVA